MSVHAKFQATRFHDFGLIEEIHTDWCTTVTVLLMALAKCLEDVGAGWYPRCVVCMVLQCKDMLWHSPTL